MTTKPYSEALNEPSYPGFDGVAEETLVALMECEDEDTESDIRFTIAMCGLSDRLDWSSGALATEARRRVLSSYFLTDSTAPDVTYLVGVFDNIASHRGDIDETGELLGFYENEFSPASICFKAHMIEAFYRAENGTTPFAFYWDQFESEERIQWEDVITVGHLRTALEDEDEVYIRTVLTMFNEAHSGSRAEDERKLRAYLSMLLTYFQFKYGYMRGTSERSRFEEAVNPRLSREEAMVSVVSRYQTDMQTIHGDVMYGNASAKGRTLFAILERAGKVLRVPDVRGGDVVSETLAIWQVGTSMEPVFTERESVEIARHYIYFDILDLLAAVSEVAQIDIEAWKMEYLRNISFAEGGVLGTWDLTDRIIDFIEELDIPGLTDRSRSDRKYEKLAEHLERLVTSTIAVSGLAGRRHRRYHGDSVTSD